MGVYSTRIDMSGKKIGRWTVTSEFVKKNKKTVHWLCVCDCGNKKYVWTVSLRNGDSLSCGCLRKEINKDRFFKGFGDIGKTYFTSIVRGANDRNFELNITIEYIWELFLKQNKKCALSGVDLLFNNSSLLQTASLDRIDSSKGYIEGNVQWVHKNINFMKQEQSDEDFIEWCNKVSDYQRSKTN